MSAARVTDRQLQALVDQINERTGSPARPWRSLGDGKGCAANVGNYHIDAGYGGVCLHRMANEAGGVTTPLTYGHVPKRELYGLLRAFLTGLEAR